MRSVVWSLWKPFLFPRTIYAWHVYILLNTLTVCALGPFCLYHARDKAFQMWQMMGISRCFQTLRFPCRHSWSLCYAFSLKDLVHTPDFSATCLFKSHVPFSLFVSPVTIIHQSLWENTICSYVMISKHGETCLAHRMTNWSHLPNPSLACHWYSKYTIQGNPLSSGRMQVLVTLMCSSVSWISQRHTFFTFHPSVWLHWLSSPWESKIWIWWACALCLRHWLDQTSVVDEVCVCFPWFQHVLF